MNANFMRTIASLAQEENRLLEITYETDGDRTTRLVETLEVNTERNYMKTWCRTRNEFRTFTLSKVVEVKVTEHKFRPPQRHEDDED